MKPMNLRRWGNRSTNRICLTCIHCGKRYDLQVATQTASRARSNDVVCPHCKGKLGKLA